jgi:hypothetical protein
MSCGPRTHVVFGVPRILSNRKVPAAGQWESGLFLVSLAFGPTSVGSFARPSRWSTDYLRTDNPGLPGNQNRHNHQNTALGSSRVTIIGTSKNYFFFPHVGISMKGLLIMCDFPRTLQAARGALSRSKSPVIIARGLNCLNS